MHTNPQQHELCYYHMNIPNHSNHTSDTDIKADFNHWLKPGLLDTKLMHLRLRYRNCLNYITLHYMSTETQQCSWNDSTQLQVASALLAFLGW